VLLQLSLLVNHLLLLVLNGSVGRVLVSPPERQPLAIATITHPLAIATITQRLAIATITQPLAIATITQRLAIATITQPPAMATITQRLAIATITQRLTRARPCGRPRAPAAAPPWPLHSEAAANGKS